MECSGCSRTFRYQRSFSRHVNQCMKPKFVKLESSNLFECASCGKAYNRRQNLVRHVYKCMQPKFSKIYPRRNYECASCGSTYNRRQNLIRHIRIQGCCISNDNFRKKNECDSCKKIFPSKTVLKRHIQSIHYSTGDPRSQCSRCGKSFNRKDSLIRHFRSCQHRCYSSDFVCAYCYKLFKKKEKLRIHIKRVHGLQKNTKPESDRLKCVLCDSKFCKSDDVLHHLINQHNVSVIHEHHRFSTSAEFYSWKSEIQKNTTSVFVKVRCHVGKNHKVSWFRCHRSGSFKSRVAIRHRRIKLQGSMKIGGYCPAEITLLENRNDDSCKVTYVCTHVGHKVCDETELAHMYLSEEEKNKLAGKISMGVPYNRILTDNINLLKEEPNLDPLYLLNKQSLHNISATYHVKPPRGASNKEEPFCENTFVVQHEQSIIFYKREGETHPIETSLNKNDIIIIVMTKLQEEMFKKFGNDIITIDGTFGTNDYDFVLHTIFVIDDWYEGVPVALAISNRNDQLFMDILMNTIKEKVGNLSPRTFLSEMHTPYFDSWRKILGPVQYQLFCKWHVDDAWRKNIRKIANHEKRSEILKRLYTLSTCLDDSIFHSDLHRLLTDPDPELHSFLQYLCDNFSENTQSWAYCYRTNAGINSNIHIKAFDRCFKYFDGKFIKSASFADCLSLLNDYLELQTKELTRKRIFGKLSSKLRDLRRRHDDVIRHGLTITVENIDDPFIGWLVSVSKESDETRSMHIVRETVVKCAGCKLYCEECDSCLHNYECTCSDNCIEFNMCVHIHGLCLYHKQNCVCSNLVDSDHQNYNFIKSPTLIEDIKVENDNNSNVCDFECKHEFVDPSVTIIGEN